MCTRKATALALGWRGKRFPLLPAAVAAFGHPPCVASPWGPVCCVPPKRGALPYGGWAARKAGSWAGLGSGRSEIILCQVYKKNH